MINFMLTYLHRPQDTRNRRQGPGDTKMPSSIIRKTAEYQANEATSMIEQAPLF
ncbi:hypothetical protein XF_0327 [Xylella fastidiosa 9a5c]|uniref:Uncharacterized protein n=1 Tax=Xylella fastidiosa (strain 9a5c) TaxID=160492 RepID=Q9PGH5_XYLFA|nr:hypothetical protein XF_0327 [Xylella fastidiosa 9a5c]